MWSTTPLLISLPLLTITIPGLYITYISHSMQGVVINDEMIDWGSVKLSETAKTPTATKQEILINIENGGGTKDVSDADNNDGTAVTEGVSDDAKGVADDTKDVSDNTNDVSSADDNSGTKDASINDETQKNPTEDNNAILTNEEQEMLTIKSKMKLYTREKINKAKREGNNLRLVEIWTKVMKKVDKMSYDKLQKLQTFLELST